MPPDIPSGKAVEELNVHRELGKATPETLKTGCIAWVIKDGEARRAEILGIKETKRGKQFYCNFSAFNKRLDEWVVDSRIDFSRDVEWPDPEKEKEKLKEPKTKKPRKFFKKRPKRLSKGKQSAHSKVTAPQSHPETEFVESQYRVSSSVGPDEDSPGRASIEVTTTPAAAEETETQDIETEKQSSDHGYPFSRKQEIEKLRTSGSMTQNPAEVSRIRNISKVRFGKFNLYPWYFSPYPESFSLEDCMYICEFCLSYYCDAKSFLRHRTKCTLRHPPGNEIYRDDHVSFFEVDGRRQRTWCRNLCLLSKMFLDHKTLYYDVDPFLFYVMTCWSNKGCHLLGYFSKEKESDDGYNVACILTLPQFQRKGYGRLLIQFSYELSKIEGKLGSPEKPLSDLGLLSYRQYWSENILDLLMEHNERDEKVTIEGISSALAMTTQDVEHTLQAMRMQVYHRSDHKIVVPDRLIQQREKQRRKARRRALHPELIRWRPPVFTASSRTWGW